MVRIKHRYLLVNILFPESFTPEASDPPYLGFHAPTPSHISAGLFISHVRNSIVTHFGDCGLGLTTASLKVIYLSPGTSTAIIRCPRQHYRIVWAALTYINDLPGVRRGEQGKACVIHVVRVSGTIRKSEEELLRRARKDLVRAKAEEDEMEESALGRVLGGSRKAESMPAASTRVYERIEDPDEEGDIEDDSE